MGSSPELMARVAAASALTVAAGAAALGLGWRRLRSATWADRLFHLAVAWTTGLALLVPLLLLAGLWGLPFNPWTLTGTALLVAGALAGARRRGPRPETGLLHPSLPQPAGDRWRRALDLASRLVLAGAVALLLAKLAAMPLWSWDHYAIWGVKAERMLPGGHLDLSFLHTREMVDSRPDYPLGLPVAWRLLALGASPGATGYRLLHGLFALALLVVLRQGLRRLSGRAALANVLAAWGAALPLFWDTAFVGIAELPLALVATVAAVLLVAGRGRAAGWGAGAALGFLPWIKQEGLPLALLLLAFGLLARPEGEDEPARGRWLRLAAPAGVGIALAQWIAAGQLAAGVSFFSGDPLARLAERLPRAWEIAGGMGDVFIAGESLGFWPVFLAAALLAAAQRRRRPLLLAGVVVFQLLLYGAITFVVYLPPEMHVAAAFPRITAALAPLGLLVVGWVLSPERGRIDPR